MAGPLRGLREAISENGWYVTSGEIGMRLLSTLRGTLLGHKLHTRDFRVGPQSYIRGISCMRIGHGFHAGTGLWLQAVYRYQQQTFQPRIVIGRNARVSNYVHIAATHLVEIGDHCLLGSKVLIIDHNHGQYSGGHSSPHQPPWLRLLDSDRSVRIGHNVWLGDAVVVGPGACIGDGCVVAANSVVRGTLPAFTLCSGNPATPFKKFDFESQEWVGSE